MYPVIIIIIIIIFGVPPTANRTSPTLQNQNVNENKTRKALTRGRADRFSNVFLPMTFTFDT